MIWWILIGYIVMAGLIGGVCYYFQLLSGEKIWHSTDTPVVIAIGAFWPFTIWGAAARIAAYYTGGNDE